MRRIDEIVIKAAEPNDHPWRGIARDVSYLLSELAAAQEEGRVTRRALEMAVHDGFTGEDRTVQEFLAHARAEAKPADGGDE